MATVERVEQALATRHVEAGATRVLHARVRFGEDSNGEPAIFVTLTLSNPAQGLQTWPAEDIWALRRTIRDVLTEVDPELETPWVISFEPEEAGDLEPEDTRGEVQIDS